MDSKHKEALRANFRHMLSTAILINTLAIHKGLDPKINYDLKVTDLKKQLEDNINHTVEILAGDL